MDKELLTMAKTFADMAQSLLSQAPSDEGEFDDLPKEWQEFFEECANVVNVVDNLTP